MTVLTTDRQTQSAGRYDAMAGKFTQNIYTA